jgi:metalloendopeptidase OMA1, mitochondrial
MNDQYDGTQPDDGRQQLGFGSSGQPALARRGLSGLRFWPILLFGAFFLYYKFSHTETNPMTQRSQMIDISRDQEMALGLQSYQQILSESQVVQSGQAADAVKIIGERIRAVSGEYAKGFEWEYNLIQDDQANAFALPGGKVAVYTGLLPLAENADGLAVVMGHEIAHALLRHSAERMAHQKLAQFGQMAVGMSIGNMDPGMQQMVMGAMGVGTQYGILLPFSRDHESEADHIGLLLMARACFDPREAPRLWERMGAASNGKGQPSEFMSTHPSHATRIRQFDTWMPEALQERAKYCADKPLQ